MGLDLKGREIGKNIYQLPSGLYRLRFRDQHGVRHGLTRRSLAELRADQNAILDQVDAEKSAVKLAEKFGPSWLKSPVLQGSAEDLPKPYRWIDHYYVMALATHSGTRTHAGRAIDLQQNEDGVLRCLTLCSKDAKAGTRDALPRQVILQEASALLRTIEKEPVMVNCTLCIAALKNAV